MNKNIKILIVEDTESDAELAKYEIRQSIGECEFRVVETKTDFLKAFDEFNPHIIVSDYSMPKFDGLTALKLCLDKSDVIPFILFTGSINEDTAVECMKLGATDYIIKEHIKRLGQSVKNALEQREIKLEKQNADKIAKSLVEDQKILLETASKLLESKSLKDIYKIVFDNVINLIDNSYIVLTSVDPEVGVGNIEHYYGFDNFYNWIVKKLNFDPKKIKINISNIKDDNKPYFLSGKLIKHPDDLYSLTLKTIPKEVCFIIEKALKFRENYYIGFTSEELIYGGLTILKKDNLPIEKAQIVEMIMQQASQAIQKYYALISAIKNEERIKTLYDISQYKSESIQDLLDKSLEEIVRLTGSKIGYIYHYYEDKEEFVLNSWSKNVMHECTIQNPQTIYKLDKTGIWGEAVRQRKPILINDYNSLNPLKKGYPDGHVSLKRYLTIPVFYGDKIVAVAGVANKETDYIQSDVDELILIMDTVWKIVKQRESDLTILENEEKYKAVMNQSMNFIYLADIDTLRIIEANPALYGSLGYSQEEIKSLTVFDFVAHSKENIDLNLKKALDSKRIYMGERNYTKKNGDIIIVEANASVISYKDKRVFCVVSHDITDRKKSELALFQSREKLKMILNYSPIGMASINEYGLLVSSNNSFKEIFHIPMNVESTNFNIFDDKFLTKKEKETLWSIESLRVEKSYTHDELESILNTKIYRTGIFDLELSIKAVAMDINAEKKEYILQIQDITDRKVAEKIKNDFINTMSHEMRTPLTAIKESMIIMNEHFDYNLFAEQKSLLEVSLRNIDRLGDLIQNVLDVQNLNDGSIELNKKPEAISNIIKGIVKNIDLKTNKPDLKLILDLDDGLPMVFVDRNRITQVINNLLSNAIKFTPNGSITIKTELDNTSNRVKVSIIDTGIGISRDNLWKIFTPFSQIRNDDNSKSRGIGLGLSISRKILLAHESDLYVISEDGLSKDKMVIAKQNNGSTFYFYLATIKY